MNNNVAIIITSCIKPNTDLFVFESDPMKRLDSVFKTINDLNDATFPYDIIISDISDSDYYLKILESKFNRANIKINISFIHVNIDSIYRNKIEKYGKGYGEIYIFKYLFKNNYLSGYNFIFKLTGRYSPSNINGLLDRINNIKNTNYNYIDFSRLLGSAITGWFFLNNNILENFCDYAVDKIDDNSGKYIEHVLYDFLFSKKIMIKKLGCIKFFDNIKSGSTGVTYNKYLNMIRRCIYLF